jgi:hypothetical protein
MVKIKTLNIPTLGFAVLLSLVPASASAQQPDTKETSGAVAEARVAYTHGTELYRAGEFKKALVEFKRAYDLAPHFAILYNIGQVNMQLNNYAAALTAFEQYLRDGGSEVPADRRPSVEADIVTLRGRTAKLIIDSNVAGAEVRVDGKLLGVTPLAPVVVDAGQHDVTVTKDGRTSTKPVMLSGAEEVRLDVPLSIALPVTPQPADETTVPVPEPERDKKEADEPGMAWVAGWVVTGAFAAGAIGVGVAALSAQSDLEDERSGATTPDDLDAAQSKALALSVTADVLAGAAVIAGAVTLYFTIAAMSSGDDEGDEASWRLRVGPGAVGIDGSF